MKSICLFLTAVFLLFGTIGSAGAYPQYAKWISKKAGFEANCAYCHSNSQGPTGSGPGQSGSLSEDARTKLHTAESLILNEFGKSLIARLGHGRVLQGMSNPEEIAEAMKAFDLDDDGISDGVEMTHGTLADDPNSAPPSLIWQVRLRRSAGFVSTVAIASIIGAIGCFGLANTYRRRRLAAITQPENEPEEETSD